MLWEPGYLASQLARSVVPGSRRPKPALQCSEWKTTASTRLGAEDDRVQEALENLQLQPSVFLEKQNPMFKIPVSGRGWSIYRQQN